jgi:hypothetical protein
MIIMSANTIFNEIISQIANGSLAQLSARGESSGFSLKVG